MSVYFCFCDFFLEKKNGYNSFYNNYWGASVQGTYGYRDEVCEIIENVDGCFMWK
jgi:hypothetical protein